MILLFALVLSILAISTDARQTPKIRLYEIVLDPESEEAVPAAPVPKKAPTKVQDTPPRSETDQLAMQLVTEIDLLLGTQNQGLYNSESQEHSFVDETRSSIVVMPPGSDKVYHIVRDTVKKAEGTEKMNKPSKSVHWIQQLFQNDGSDGYRMTDKRRFEEQGQDHKMRGVEDGPKTSAGKLAMQLVSEIDLLFGHQSEEPSDSQSQEHSIFDETRSSIVVMPPDSDKVYHIVRDTVKKPEGDNKINRPSRNSMEFVQHLQRDDISNDYEMRMKSRSSQQLPGEIS